MKKLSTVIAAAVIALGSLLLAPAAHAQPTPSYSYQALALPATLAAATTTNFATPLFIDAHAQQNVAIMTANSWSTAGETTGNTNILYSLAPTVDGSNYSTNNLITIASYNRSGTAGQVSYSSTNLSANGLKGWYVVKAVNNSAAGVATNTPSTAFVYGIKIGAP